MKGSEMPWSFSRKASAIHPQYLSFNTGQENISGIVVNDSLPSSGFSSVSTPDAFDSSHDPFSSMLVRQKNMSPEKHRTNDYAWKSYSVAQFDGFSVHSQKKMKIMPLPKQQNHIISIFQSPFASTGQSLIANSMSSPSVGGGLPTIMNPVTVQQTPSSFVGRTDIRNGSKPCGSPAQMTIFYGGSVCVYDDVSPEKAQAIMLLAGNGSSTTQNKKPTTAQVQAPITRPSVGEGYAGGAKSPNAELTSPVSVTSGSTNELATVRPTGVLAFPSNQIETHIAVKSSSATIIPAGAVPQARKASLTRFLEKRKERVMNACPYNGSKRYAVAGS